MVPSIWSWLSKFEKQNKSCKKNQQQQHPRRRYPLILQLLWENHHSIQQQKVDTLKETRNQVRIHPKRSIQQQQTKNPQQHFSKQHGLMLWIKLFMIIA
jgi:hypothetical protein